MTRNSFALAAAAAMVLVGCAGDVGPENAKVGTARQALVTNFAAGSFIIPMGNNHQDTGMIRAYGLAYALLRANVPVHWAVLPNKAASGNDFTITAPATVINHESKANIATPVTYRGGPFIVSAADRAAALPVITAWLAADTVTVVHELTAGTLTADIVKTLVAAPSIGVFEDGYEDIAYDNLNAAGIRDSAGNAWTLTSPTSFSPALVAGTAGDNADGALFVSGFPSIAFLSSEHYNNPDEEVVAEVRSWLDAGPFAHAYMQCAAATAFENMAPANGNLGGRFLTTAGLGNGGGIPNPLTNRLPSDPLTQFDGNIAGDTGTTQTMSLLGGSAFRTGVRTLINEDDEPLTQEILFLTGNLDGNVQNGRVTYLAGHDFSLATPVSTSPQTNGARLYFNSIFDSPAALAGSQPAITVTKAAPAATTASTVTFTINYTNAGPGPALGVVITDPVPPGTTFASATGGGTQAGGIVTWTIGALGPAATGSVTFTVNVAADATITNQATVSYRAWQTNRTALSNTTSTVRDTTAPDTTIVSGPPATTASPSATFDFSSTEPGAVFECSLDGGAFAPCTDPVTFTNLAKGQHTLAVRSKDAAGNTDATPATQTWTINDGGTPDGGPGNVDTDGDGLTDAVEKQIGTNPNDADSDDDGVPDGQEPSFDKDTDLDGLINALDPDSDNDGLFDGTELGLGCGLPATNLANKHCVADADNGTTKTDPLDRDTDNGGVSDGSEDKNLNGAIDVGETDPTAGHGADDLTVVDTDGDGLSDGLEVTLGSNPNDADSDDDGLRDGDEANPSDDTDGDGKKNILDADSDGDGLFDGTESGKGCEPPATDISKASCVADADNGATKTSPIDPDTDNGGVKDGDEDTNKNGRVDPGERDPNVTADDNPGCKTDTQCGDATSGRVCVAGQCVPGCRAGGNGCPTAQVCSSTTEVPGTCGPAQPADAGQPPLDPNLLEGGGFDCSAAPGSSHDSSNAPTAAVAGILALAMTGLRRRRRAKR